MYSSDFWIPVICICGAVQCLFLACCFGLGPARGTLPQRLLAVLMLLLGVRILKSVYYIFAGEQMSIGLMNLGFAAHLGAAVLLYLYVKSMGVRAVKRLEVGKHLATVALLVLASPWLTLDDFWYRGGYHLLLAASLVYWFWAFRLYLDWRRSTNQPAGKTYWLPTLLTGTGIFFFAYFSNYVLRIIPYSVAPAIYSLAVFPVGIAAWRNFTLLLAGKAPVPLEKYRNLSLSPGEADRGKMAVLKVVEEEQAFLEPDFSLGQLSERTGLPIHVLSHILNQHLHTNFNNLLNKYRIQEACRLLHHPDRQNQNIAAIAFEVGFNSLSAFNHHFKRLQGKTPSAFRRQLP